MISALFNTIILLAVALPLCSTQPSCRGRCGAEYYRGSICQCDYECLVYEECCKDYESQCTTKKSCKGRCGETFRRGRVCSCDGECNKYKQCCPDYQGFCPTEETTNGPDSTAAPTQPSSCDIVNNNKPKDPSSTKPFEEENVTPFIEEDNPDFIPVVTPPDPQDVNDEAVYDQIFTHLPDDPYSESGQDEPVTQSNPEGTSGSLPETTLSPTLPSKDEAYLSGGSPTFPAVPSTSHISSQATQSSETQPGPTPTDTPHISSQATQSSETQPGPTPTDTPHISSQATQSSETQPGPTPTDTPYISSQATYSSETQPGPTPTDTSHISSQVTQSSETQPGPTPTDAPHISSQATQSSATQPGPTPTDNSHISSQVTQSSETQPGPTPTDTPHISSQATQSSEVQTGPTPTDNSQDEGSGVLADIMNPEVTQDEDPTKPSPEQTEVVPSDPDVIRASTKANLPSASPTTVPQSMTSTQGSTPEISTSSSDQTSTTEGGIKNSDGTRADVADSPVTIPPSGPGHPNASDVESRRDTTEGWSKTGSPNELVTSSPTPTQPTNGETVDGVTIEGTSKAPNTPTPTKTPSEPQAKPVPSKPLSAKPNVAKPTRKPRPSDNTQTLNIDKLTDYQADDSNDTNLCSGRPATALTTLRNGTIVVFRGHYFWMLDRYRVPGPARGITEVWGVPSPLDTVFSRCNCQGITYIFKGMQYWRFDNDVVDPGYPKPIEAGFDGLRGHITAALSVPQYKQRKESVYFFKRGGLVQKYSYQYGTSPTCGRKPHVVYTVRNRVARQAVSFLGPPINIHVSWKGFPSTVTSAVSVPSRFVPEGYKYYVFSRSKYYSVRLADERPVIAAPLMEPSGQTNAAEDFFKCSKTV